MSDPPRSTAGVQRGGQSNDSTTRVATLELTEAHYILDPLVQAACACAKLGRKERPDGIIMSVQVSVSPKTRQLYSHFVFQWDRSLSECRWLKHVLRSPEISASGMAGSRGSNAIIRSQSQFLHFSFLPSSEKAVIPGWAHVDLIGVTCPFLIQPQ